MNCNRKKERGKKEAFDINRKMKITKTTSSTPQKRLQHCSSCSRIFSSPHLHCSPPAFHVCHILTLKQANLWQRVTGDSTGPAGVCEFPSTACNRISLGHRPGGTPGAPALWGKSGTHLPYKAYRGIGTPKERLETCWE